MPTFVGQSEHGRPLGTLLAFWKVTVALIKLKFFVDLVLFGWHA